MYIIDNKIYFLFKRLRKKFRDQITKIISLFNNKFVVKIII